LAAAWRWRETRWAAASWTGNQAINADVAIEQGADTSKARADLADTGLALNPRRPVKRERQEGGHKANRRPIKPLLHTEPPHENIRTHSTAKMLPTVRLNSINLIRKFIDNHGFVNSHRRTDSRMRGQASSFPQCVIVSC
jgi:hypothetical protein